MKTIHQQIFRLFKMKQTEREESLDALGLRVRVVKDKALLVVADSGRERKESQETEEVLGVGESGVDGVLITDLGEDEVQAQRFLTEDGLLLQI